MRARTIALLAFVLVAVPPVAAAQDVEETVVGGGVFVPPDDEPAEQDEAAEDGSVAGEEGAEEDPTAGDAEVPAPPTARFTPPERPAPTPIRFTLDNGLRVVMVPVEGRRFAGLAVTYGVGSASVPSGWTGLAHLTEHLMFAGTDVLDEVETYLRLEAAGAVERNGETGPDRTVFYEELPASELQWALYLEAERMARMLAGLSSARLERQRQVVLHEGWERGVYGWRGALTRSLYRGVFGETHPYSQIVEREGDVAAVRLRHVQWFFQRHYRPDNATLTVVGGFDAERMREAIERYFGRIRATGPAAAPTSAPEVERLDHERHITVEIQDDRDQLYLAWPTPALYANGDAALDVVSTLLFEDREAPIRAALLESGLALEVAVRQRSHALGSVFTVHAIPAPGRQIDELREAVDRVLTEVRERGFTEEEVARARARWARPDRALRREPREPRGDARDRDRRALPPDGRGGAGALPRGGSGRGSGRAGPAAPAARASSSPPTPTPARAPKAA